jgi:acetyl-CoA acyltransferase
VASQWKVTREEQDAFAAASHAKAIAAIAAGKFKAEISPYAFSEHLPDLERGEVKLKQRTADTDEGPRADSTAEKLAKLRPVFAAKGSVTAGNSSQMSDGAAAVLLVSEKMLKQFNLKPLARFAGYSVAGVPPEIMGIGPIEAIPRALALAGISKQDLDWIELNEAFAAQSLAVMKTLELDPAKVNPLGGAIALGHPLGATGAIRTATVVHALQRENLKWGMVTMCIGTGMGAAGIFERL